MNYYEKQLTALAGDGAKIKLTSSAGETNWLDVNADSAAAICAYLIGQTSTHDRLHYHAEGRNGYYAIDEYKNPEGDRFSNNTRSALEVFKTRKQAESVCGLLNDLAYTINALRGLEK